MENPLSVLRPDDWNNIPICLVSAFKHIMNANEQTYQSIKVLEAK